MRIVYVGSDYFELRSHAREIAAWLSSDKFEKLIFDDEPNKYYIAQVSEELDLLTFFESGIIDVVFDCQPFAYSNDRRHFFNPNFGLGATYNGELLIYVPNVPLEEAGGLLGDRVIFSSAPTGHNLIAYAVNKGTREITPSTSPIIQFTDVSRNVTNDGMLNTAWNDEPGAFSIIGIFGKWERLEIRHYIERFAGELNPNNDRSTNYMLFNTPGEGALIIDNLALTIKYFPKNIYGGFPGYNWLNELYSYGEYRTIERFFTVAPGRNYFRVRVNGEEYDPEYKVTVHVAYLPMWL
jgi:hypothetical protein